MLGIGKNLVSVDQWSVPQKFVSGLGAIICIELADSLVSWLLFESWFIESGWLTRKSATTYRYGYEKFIRHESLIQMDITTQQSYKKSWLLQAWAWRSQLECLFSVNCDNLEFFSPKNQLFVFLSKNIQRVFWVVAANQRSRRCRRQRRCRRRRRNFDVWVTLDTQISGPRSSSQQTSWTLRCLDFCPEGQLVECPLSLKLEDMTIMTQPKLA